MKIIRAWARFNGRLICHYAKHDYLGLFGQCRRCARFQRYAKFTLGDGRIEYRGIISHIPSKATFNVGGVLRAAPSSSDFTITKEPS